MNTYLNSLQFISILCPGIAALFQGVALRLWRIATEITATRWIDVGLILVTSKLSRTCFRSRRFGADYWIPYGSNNVWVMLTFVSQKPRRQRSSRQFPVDCLTGRTLVCGPCAVVLIQALRLCIIQTVQKRKARALLFHKKTRTMLPCFVLTLAVKINCENYLTFVVVNFF